MSKAFTRESDDLTDEPVLPRQSTSLPPGAKNYLTPKGARQLREELAHLIQTKRPQIAASSQGDNTKRELQDLDQRMQHLEQSLQSAVVVTPPVAPWEQVRFGATVTVKERNGSESRYRIVGVDETDIDRNWVSWLSPIAKGLLNARLGQRVRFKLPSGETELEVVGITYE